MRHLPRLALRLALRLAAGRVLLHAGFTALVGVACERVLVAPGAAGFGLSPRDLAVPLTSRVDTAGSFRLLIERRVPDAVAGRLLDVAEATYPPHGAVLAASDGRLSGADSAEVDLWWSTEFDGVRMPYAITSGAVRYYVTLTEAYRRGEPRQVGSIPMQSSSLTYHASIEQRAELRLDGRAYRDVYAATLSLSWSGVCGPLCAQWVRKERVVVLDARGRVVAVVGDGAPALAAS